MHTRNPDSTYRLPLPPHPIAAEQARVLTRIALADWRVIDDVLIVVAELVANAVKMGDVFHLTISRKGDTALIEVWDPGEATPDRRRRSVDRVDGRGLLLVEACSKDWGWRLEEQGGKTIWAVCDRDVEPEKEIPSCPRQTPTTCSGHER
ncbi:ATP-binding protein [Actinomadura sp. DC4]|uniref:ATP-binding protein n=1 Tax=Actinomadura sp. DC4 TaxID=3055069 RepID=UPI0025AFF50A|nr:ATP-binding protein [Actinomadura sp. DC4]MDN3355577.1 ATP-binding protein [Actinomadura sp. DC4]